MLVIKNLNKSFGGTKAIVDFCAEVDTKQIIGIIGPNGAGKTTILNTISNIIAPDSGSIELDGKKIVGKEKHKIAHMGISRTFQNIRLFSNMTVLENILVVLKERFPKMSNAELRKKAIGVLEEYGWTTDYNMRPDNLPYGMKRKLELIRAMSTRPCILMLDEPAAGMNPTEIKELISYIKHIRETYDVGIVLIEHRMEVVLELCDRIYVQNFGETIAVGTPEEITKDERVIEAYIGGVG